MFGNLRFRSENSIILSSIMLLSIACSSERLQPLKIVALSNVKPGKITAEYCSPETGNIEVMYRLIYLMDFSGSNILIPPNLPGTDPNGDVKRNFFIGLTQSLQAPQFAGRVGIAAIRYSDDATFITTPQNEMVDPAQAIGPINSILDANQAGGIPYGGWTNWLAALDRAISVINADANDIEVWNANNPSNPRIARYAIINTTDGSPIYNSVPQTQPQIQAKTEELLSLASRQVVASVNVHGVFYHTSTDINAENNVNFLANVGRGLFVNARNGGTLDPNLFRPVDIQAPKTQKLAMAYNPQVRWAQDPQNPNVRVPQRDTDADGLADAWEIFHGTNLSSRFSGGSTVSDWLQITAFGNFDPTRQSSAPGNQDGDYLSSYAESILDTSDALGNIDTNGNGVPDDILAFNGIPASFDRRNDVFADPDSDGVLTINELKANTDPKQHNDSIVNLVETKYQLEVISTSPTQECYRAVVTDIPTIGLNNTVRLLVSFSEDIGPFSESIFFEAQGNLDQNNEIVFGNSSFIDLESRSCSQNCF